MANNQRKFKISVVMPIYNTERYINEAIDSVINQSIGFTDNVQLILINDGSSDRSEEICKAYQADFPENIVYKYKENGGVSDACNHGIPYVSGEYVNFMSSDDFWEADAFEHAYDFFDRHANEIDVLSCKIDYFERFENKPHPLDKKYTEDAIIDLNIDYDKVNSTIGNTFVKAEKLIETQFNTSLIMFEDGTLLAKIMLDKCKYGIVSSVRYLYRKRENLTSLTASASLDRRLYIDVTDNFYFYLINLSMKKYGKVLDFIQYLLMYHLQFQTRNINVEKVLNEQELYEYKNKIGKVLEFIDPKVIYVQGKTRVAQRLSILNKKFNCNVIDSAEYRDKGLYFGGHKIFALDSKRRVRVYGIQVRENELIIEGTTDLTLLGDKAKLQIIDNNNKSYDARITKYTPAIIYSLFDGQIEARSKFEFRIPLPGVNSLHFSIIYNNSVIDIKAFWESSSKMTENFPSRYVCKKEYIIRLVGKNIIVEKYTFRNNLISELRILKRIINDKKFSLIWPRLRYKGGEYNIIISPKYMTEDNKVAFKNISETTGIETKIVDSNSCRLDKLLLNAKNIYISDIGLNLASKLKDNWKYMQDLCVYKTVYLNPGTIAGNFPKWKNKYRNSINVITAQDTTEKKSIVNSNNGYGDDDVAILKHAEDTNHDKAKANKLLVLFSWNRVLAGNILEPERIYDSSHKDSFVYDIYDKLTNSEELKSVLEEKKLKCLIMMHPSYSEAPEKYDFSGLFEFSSDYSRVIEAIKESCLLLTDQSHYALSFIRQNKPVVFYQFDDIGEYSEGKQPESFERYVNGGFDPKITFNKAIESLIETVRCIEITNENMGLG